MSSNPYRDSHVPGRRDSQRRHHQSSARHSSSSRRRHSSTDPADAYAVSDPHHHRQRRDSSSRRQRDDYRDLHSHNRRRRSSAQRPSSGHGRAETINEKPRSPYTEGPEVRVSEYHSGNMPSPWTPSGQGQDRDPMLETVGRSGSLSRKKSLVRPERRRNNPDEPDYYYRQHAQNMNVMPSTTGRDPQMEEDIATLGSDSTNKPQGMEDVPLQEKSGMQRANSAKGSKRNPNKLTRNPTKKERDHEEKERRRQKIQDASGTPTLWGTYCHVITFWCPNVILRCFGFKAKEQQRAWREKMGLISIILLIMLFVGFLTFGFTQTVCPEGGPLRLRINKVGDGYMIFHGKAYDLTRSQHPLARGVPDGSNVLWDADPPGKGMDGSFLFQNVNGACKGMITAAQGSDVPTDDSGNLAWYFPCNMYKQDGSSQPNQTIPYYLGYSCHTSRMARDNFYGLRSSGDVFFTWDDVRNQSRNLMVYSGDVLDLDLLEWFNKTQVAYPDKFDEIRLNSAVRGKDVTLAFSSGDNKQVAQCFQDIIKVGSIDTETIGCIASKVVLYVSLIFILSIVVIKFVLAIVFQWILCRKYSADKTSMTSDKKKRQQQIEDWTEDIYRPPPKITDPGSVSGSDRNSKRGSFLPTTSRFTSPYAMERSLNRKSIAPTTMISQHSSSRLGPAMYGQINRSESALAYTDANNESRASLMESHNFSGANTRYSSVMHTDTDMSGPQGFIHEAVVPQPPPEWQPFGFPLAHTICLVTAYSEGPDGIRTTLDSIAMTDYPNSHKLIYVVCDGLIQGKGEKMSTPDACISMMKDFAVLPDEVQPFSYVAVASGSKRHNMAKVYCAFYDYGPDSIIPLEKQQRVPIVCVVKCGTPTEENASKPGNRGKRDSQIILMSFLQKVMFDERMTELEYEMFNGIWKLTGISPDFYEIVLMVDADTKVFPDSLTHMVSAMVKDPEIMGLCGETKIANKRESWVSMIQVFEYFISHHQAKSFESVFGGVTCLPGCFCMYRIKAPKGGQNYWVPILANPDIVEHYSENVVDTLHKKNLLLLGEDRYLSTLMLKTFPKRKQMFIPQAVCKTTVPAQFKVLLSQRRRWINSTVHNLMELVLVRDLCGTFCFSMQFVVFIELVGTLVLPAAIAFTFYVVALGIKAAITHTEAPTIPLVLLALILGLPGVLIVITAHKISYVLWMFVYLLSLPVWNFVLPTYAYWHFDDFSWGDTRQAAGEAKGGDKSGHGGDGEFDSSKITMKRWHDFEQERRLRGPQWGNSTTTYGGSYGSPSHPGSVHYTGHERKPSSLML
ncbi:glycosyltransferase family 2 protein [Zasmidium cellare ATCC 36951]|uniref:chitin synthase n=1 Tax=Zasmidium cellare ATCC 36951 TaxID=1080233 RepID=A0A6A6CBQ3_ZASCE|nr:glycosyltransferase family 2 protein [Zasmidium cellare ATCC 36951]KAF2164451.1 glycosyltransferase family 2 protein [Zasmidium cellare ATCC 36951]